MVDWIPDAKVRIEPKEGELVRDFVLRVYAERQILISSPGQLRKFKCFHEVAANPYDEEVERWIFENADEGSYFYTTENIWFFNDDGVAAMFKLLHGKDG